jgi:ketosteroid isomerase-like protein
MIGDTDTLNYQTYKYMHVWYKQQNGSYKISREMWNN